MIAATTFAHETVAVFGLARSGLAAARSLQAGGADVLAWDDAEDRRSDAAASGVPLQDLYGADFGGVAALVLSPGVPLTHPAPHPVAARASAAGTAVIGDVELLLREDLPAKLVGVTGAGVVETVSIAPPSSPAANYGFDVTPARMVTGLITERGFARASKAGLAALYPEKSGH